MIEGLFQPMHMIFLLGLALLFFGPSKLPQLGKGLGESIKNFREAMKEGLSEPESRPQLPAAKISDDAEA